MKRKLLLFIATLLLGGVMYAQDYHFGPDFDYHDYQRPMIIIGQVYFNDVVQNSADIEIASFVGDEVRGRVMLMEPYPSIPDLGYFAYLPCYYNSTGETFTFKAYDHATGKEYDVCSTTAVGRDDGYGEVDSPYDFNFTVEEEIPFGPTYPWEPVSYPGEGMLVVAQIQISGEQLSNANWELGAFCGEECRGICDGLDDWTSDNLGYFAFINIMGNDGDIIEFYLFDKANDKVLEATCNTTVTLANGDELGIDILNGDIFVLNFADTQTFEKEIIGYEGNKDYYYLIASPIGNVNPSLVTNMLENSYDLFYFDQSQAGEEWRNFKIGGGYELEAGKGYLYANSEDVTLYFTGQPYNGEGKVTLNKAETTWGGWNLVGNPFGQTAYITKAFYTMNGSGSEFQSAVAGTEIPPMEGLFVIADYDEEELIFSTEAPGKSANLMISVSNSSRNADGDRAFINFDEGSKLPKFMLNGSNTKLYIPEEGKNYAIVNAENHGEVALNFKAHSNGNFTLNFKPEDVEFSYLHLTDLLTGTEVDLLESPSYNFNALNTDNAYRFKLVFDKSFAGVDEDFAFINNGDIIINGQGTVQVIDALGRILSSHGSDVRTVSTNGMTPGVYVLRLINGMETKTQKIIVK